MRRPVNDNTCACGASLYLSKALPALLLTVILTSRAFILPAQAEPMSGTYIIGPEGDYTSLSEAMADIRERKVEGWPSQQHTSH